MDKDGTVSGNCGCTVSFGDTSQGQACGSVACGVEAASPLEVRAGISASEVLANIGSIEPQVPQFKASTELFWPHSAHRTLERDNSWRVFIGIVGVWRFLSGWLDRRFGCHACPLWARGVRFIELPKANAQRWAVQIALTQGEMHL